MVRPIEGGCQVVATNDLSAQTRCMTWTDPIVLVAILAAALAALLTGLAGLWLQNRDRRLRSAALRQALACEVEELHDLLYEPPKVALERENGRRKTDRDYTRRLDGREIPDALQERFPHGFDRSIYLANLDRLGEMRPNLARRTVRFYQAIGAYEADVKAVIAGELQERFFRERAPQKIFHHQLRMAVRAEIMAKRLRGERARPKFGRRRLPIAAKAWLCWRKRLKESAMGAVAER